MSTREPLVSGVRGSFWMSTIERAVAAWGAGQRPEAERLCRLAANEGPLSIEGQRLLGDIEFAGGRFEAAARAWRAVTLARPDDALAFRRLATALLSIGSWTEAVDALRAAVALEPGDTLTLNNLGHALNECGRYFEALEALRTALRLKSDYAAAHYNLGLAQAHLRDYAAAVRSFQSALAHRPELRPASVSCGRALRDSGRFGEARASFERALALEARDAPVLCDYANTLYALGRTADALGAFDAALALEPARDAARLGRARCALRLGDAPTALAVAVDTKDEPHQAGWLALRARALLALGRKDEALAEAERAVAADARSAQALLSRGLANLAAGELQVAEADCRAARGLDPFLPEACVGHARALSAVERPSEALAALERAVALEELGCVESLRELSHVAFRLGEFSRASTAAAAALAHAPDDAMAAQARAGSLLLSGRFAEAVPAFIKLQALAPSLPFLPGFLFFARRLCCDWQDYEPQVAALTDAIRAGRTADRTFPPLSYCTDPEDIARAARTFADFQGASKARPRPKVEASGPIRLAYISADFRAHAVAHLTSRLFELHDRSRFELTAVSLSASDGSAERARLERSFDHFLDVANWSDREVAAELRKRGIGIAVDLTGDTVGGRFGILADRAAAIQVNWLGFPGTLGAKHVDYLIADATVIPDEEHRHYSEQIVTLPDCYLVTDDQLRITPETPSRASLGLPESGFVYCALHSGYKINPALFDTWMQILKRVPESVLWLSGEFPVRRNLAREARARGVDPARLVFTQRVQHVSDYLARFRCADLFLDALPYNGHATSCDVLWAGLPLLAQMGTTFPGRVAASALRAAGFPELIARTTDEYLGTAVALAGDPERLAALRAKLAQARSHCALFDTARFRDHLESAYLGMWERYRRGEAPAAIRVPARS
jgi:protein O-GlcNAc transferase